MDTDNGVIVNHAVRHNQRLFADENEDMRASLNSDDNVRRIKRKKHMNLLCDLFNYWYLFDNYVDCPYSTTQSEEIYFCKIFIKKLSVQIIIKDESFGNFIEPRRKFINCLNSKKRV